MTLSATFSPQPFGRIVTAMVTPFDASGAVDFQLAGRLAFYLNSSGCSFIVVGVAMLLVAEAVAVI